MNLSVIIVNYKTRELIKNCLDSLFQYNKEISYQVIIVDNDSNDQIDELLQQEYPGVNFIQMGYNAGFARANNAGIRQADTDVVLLLNSDTIQIDDSIEKCYHQFSKSSHIACGIQLLNEDGSPQITGNYFMKGGLNHLLPLPYTGAFLKKVAQIFKVKKTSIADTTGNVEVDWINGAFLMVKKSAMKEVGLMDEDFFLYAEEAEWCSRLKKEGTICLFGEYHTIHLQGTSANAQFASSGKGYFNLFDQKGLQIMLSNLVRIRKQYGMGWVLFNLCWQLLTIPVFGVGLLLAKIVFQKSSKYSFWQWKGYVKNMYLLLGYLPKLYKNKPYFYKVL